jgi:ADP-heptose:LPS heptosyltransferase
MASDNPWISPYGGLGDALMLSGVLKQVIDRHPEKRFNLITRTKYGHLLSGHAAIDMVGHPPDSAVVIHADYWSTEEYTQKGGRAYQVLASLFGLPTPIVELLHVPWEYEDDPFLMSLLPPGGRKIAISPSTDSPKKQWPIAKFEELTAQLVHEGSVVCQFGRMNDPYVRGSHSLLGLTSPRQAISLLRHFDCVITQDSFFMHAAHLLNIPAVVMWGGTCSKVYGYAGQHHLSPVRKCSYGQGCIMEATESPYADICRDEDGFCMQDIAVEDVMGAVQDVVGAAIRRGAGLPFHVTRNST